MTKTGKSNWRDIQLRAFLKHFSESFLVTSELLASFGVLLPILFWGCASELNRDITKSELSQLNTLASSPPPTPTPTTILQSDRKEFPDGSVSNGWTNMSDNILLLHFNEGQFSSSFEETSGTASKDSVSCLNFASPMPTTSPIPTPTNFCPESGAYGVMGNGVELKGGAGGGSATTSTLNKIKIKLDSPETKNNTFVTVEFWMLWESELNGTVPFTVIPIGFVNYAVKIQTGTINAKSITAIGFTTTMTGADLWGIDTALIPLDKRWVHIAAVFANGKNPKNSLLYIDGQLQPLAQIFGTTNGNLPAGSEKVVSSTFRIGDWISTPPTPTNPDPSVDSARMFRGHIDELAIFNRQLSSEEILAHYNRQAP